MLHTKKLLKNAFLWNILDKLLNQTIFLGVTFYIARLIGPENVGLVGVVLIALVLLEAPVSSAMSQALLHKGIKLDHLHKCVGFYLIMGWAIISFALVVLASPAIEIIFEIDIPISLVCLMATIIIFNSLGVVPRSSLVHQMNFHLQAFSGFIAVVASSLITISLTNYFQNYWIYAILLVSKSFLQNTFLLYFSGWRPKLLFNKVVARSLFSYSLNISLAGFLANGISNIYILVVARIFNEAILGFYTQGLSLVNLLSNFVSNSIQGISFSALVSVSDDKRKFSETFSMYLSAHLIFTVPLFGTLALLSKPVVFLVLGSEWVGMAPILSVLSIGRIFSPLNGFLMTYLNVIGKSRHFLYLDLLKMPFILLYIAMFSRAGPEGMAFAMLCSIVTAFFVNMYFPKKDLGLKITQVFSAAGPYVFSTIISLLVINSAFSMNSFSSLITAILLGACVYLLLLRFIFRDKLLLKIIKSFTRSSSQEL